MLGRMWGYPEKDQMAWSLRSDGGLHLSSKRKCSLFSILSIHVRFMYCSAHSSSKEPPNCYLKPVPRRHGQHVDNSQTRKHSTAHCDRSYCPYPGHTEAERRTCLDYLVWYRQRTVLRRHVHTVKVVIAAQGCYSISQSLYSLVYDHIDCRELRVSTLLAIKYQRGGMRCKHWLVPRASWGCALTSTDCNKQTWGISLYYLFHIRQANYIYHSLSIPRDEDQR